MSDVTALSGTILVCDEDRAHSLMLGTALGELGYAVEHARSHAEAFALACARDFHALVTAPFLRDGSALALPTALGIRRPLVIVLASRLGERLATDIVERAGFDAQWMKALDAGRIHRLVRETIARSGSGPDDRKHLRRTPR